MTAHQTYQQTQYKTVDKSRLLVMMFEGVIRFNKLLKINMEKGNVNDCYYYQTKVLQFMAELTNSLNPEIELGQVLFNLYEYVTVEIGKINVRNKETDKLVEITNILEDLMNTLKKAFGIKTNFKGGR